MNSPLMRWLLDLETIPRDAETVRLTWGAPIPEWVWVLIVAAAALVAMASYRRLVGARKGRIALAVIRCSVLLLAAVLLARPMIEMPREEIEPDSVIMLVDRSASMTLEDVEDAALGGTDDRISRDEQLREALAANRAAFERIGEDRRTYWLGFHDGAFALDVGAAESSNVGDAEDAQDVAIAVPMELGEPTGRRTDLAAAIEQGLQRAAGRPITGVIVMSDGRTSAPVPRSLVRRLQAEGVELFAVPLGSSEPIGDLALRRVDAPRQAFIRDRVPVTVELDRFGSAVRDRKSVV